MVSIFDQVKRVLKKTGSLWVVIGDTYSSSEGASRHLGYTDSKYPNRRSGSFVEPSAYEQGVKAKSQCGIPERFKIAMIDSGYICRNTIIWFKRNSMPSSVSDRFTTNFEYLFFFVKSNKTQFWTNEKTLQVVTKKPIGTKGKEGIDWEWREIGEDYSDSETKIGKEQAEKLSSPRARVHRKPRRKKVSLWSGHDYYFEQQFEEQQEVSIKRAFAKDNLDIRKDKNNEQFTISGEKQKQAHAKVREQIKQGIIPKRNMRCVWDVPTYSSRLAHFAVFPEVLIDIPIRACSPEFICKKCGKPKVKIYESDWREHRNGNWKEAETKGKEMQRTDSHRQANVGGLTQITEPSNLTFKGYACCNCKSEFEGGVVLDPFAGVGTVGIVAQKLGRKYIMIDLSLDYVEMIKKNLQQGWLV